MASIIYNYHSSVVTHTPQVHCSNMCGLLTLNRYVSELARYARWWHHAAAMCCFLSSVAASHFSRTLLLTSCPSACAVCTGEGTGASGVTCKLCVNNLQVLKTNNANTNGGCGEWHYYLTLLWATLLWQYWIWWWGKIIYRKIHLIKYTSAW
jgi:hypothetical protein